MVNYLKKICLLVHYVEEKDGLIRRHIVEALSVIKFSASSPVKLPPNTVPLWTDRWHSFPAICWTPWTFVLRHILAIATSWCPPDLFNFQDPQIVLALLDLVLLMLHLGADVKTEFILRYDASILLTKLLSSIHFNAQLYAGGYELYREEILRKCDDVQGCLTLGQPREEVHESPGQVRQPSEVPDLIVPYGQPFAPQSEEVSTWLWVKSWMPWIGSG